MNLLETYPEINDIIDNIILEKFGIERSYNYKSWDDFGLDELDLIDITIELEKILLISIDDCLFIDFTPQDILIFRRNKIINKIIN